MSSMQENDVIQTDSCVCHEMNILALSALEKQPGLFCVETFQFSKYFKNVFNSQLNLSSSTDVYGFKNGFYFVTCSIVFLTFKQSKNLSNISQNTAVAVASGGPKFFKTTLTELLRI